jgi:hypothetical protein
MGFDDQGTNPRAAGRVGRDPEQGFGVGRLPQDQLVRITAKLDEARRMDQAAMPLGFIGAKPEDRRPAAYSPERDHGGKSGRARPVIGLGGKQLVNPSARQAAAERGIDSHVSGRDPPVGGQQPATGNQSQISPQHGKMINRLAHLLFLICSQVRSAARRVKLAKNQGNEERTAIPDRLPAGIQTVARPARFALSPK